MRNEPRSGVRVRNMAAESLLVGCGEESGSLSFGGLEGLEGAAGWKGRGKRGRGQVLGRWRKYLKVKRLFRSINKLDKDTLNLYTAPRAGLRREAGQRLAC